jgi:hypothetical protein
VISWRFKFSDILSILARFKSKPPIVDRPPAPEPESPAFKIAWVDMREHKRTKSRGRSKGNRSWQEVLGVTLHQTAVVIGSPDRCLNMPVHGAVLDDGEGGAIIVLLHDPTALLWHGNGFNTHDIGIEIACRACGIEGDPRTLWLPKKLKHLTGEERLAEATEATPAQLEGARQLAKYYSDLVSENGGQLQFVHAHRQATSQRVSDPGSRIWGAVGEWCRTALGLSVGAPDFKISSGKALPDAWTGKANGIRYNWQVDGRIKPD